MRSELQNVDTPAATRRIVSYSSFSCGCVVPTWMSVVTLSMTVAFGFSQNGSGMAQAADPARPTDPDHSTQPSSDEPRAERLNSDPATDLDTDRDTRGVPEALRGWQAWAVWDDKFRSSPAVYSDAGERIPFWLSKLALMVDASKGRWELDITTFSDTWVPLPGSEKVWPIDVKSNGAAIAVLRRDDWPAVQLGTGTYRITGSFTWSAIPQRLRLPPEVGIVDLEVHGEGVPTPTWSTDGQLWLRRGEAMPAEKDLLSLQVYRLLRDGIPMWLETEIELTVSGTSREEELGWLLPDGFLLSTVESPIPVAIDRQGRIRAQVRAGKWTIRTRSFRTHHCDTIAFAPHAAPMIDTELVGFEARPEYRVAEIDGLETIDVTQTTFPQSWRSFPVYRWKTGNRFQLDQKVRGMGQKHVGGLDIQRQLWLDDDGAAFTYQDSVSGQLQQIWRLDVAGGHELGAVRSAGEGQLITRNPQTHSVGVEIRSRTVDLQAVGRVPNQNRLPATGWLTDAKSLETTLILRNTSAV